MRSAALLIALAAAAGAAVAKLPPPTDDAKAKAAEAAAKSAHADKVAAYKLCQRQDQVASKYLAQARQAGKSVAPTETPACADPGPFVAAPPAAPASAAKS